MRKIMFNNNFGLEDAVLDGRKTMTRRFRNDYNVGDVIAIAQSYSLIADLLSYDYDYKNWFRSEAGYYNKMFVKAAYMPYRIIITGKRAERLQDISHEDCLREGVFVNYFRTDDSNAYAIVDNGYIKYFPTSREAFAYMIDKICGRGTWDSNQRVWVYEFELIKNC